MAFHFALGLQYDGSQFHGWQWQADRTTVQQVLEQALTRIAAAPIRVVASGRTDAGVHATGQIVSFVTRSDRPLDAWVRGTNSLLPADVSVRWAQPVDPGFHARFSATSRRYMYVVLSQTQRPALGAKLVTWERAPLDDDAMHRGAQALVGERDFSSFRGAGCQARTPHRCIHQIAVRRFGALVVLDVTANAFLQHMVRNIAGVLLEVGRGRESTDVVARVLAEKNRTAAARTAPAAGLYLVEVQYGTTFSTPPSLAPLPLLGVSGLW